MRALEIFVTIFMISHFICVVLLAIFNIRYRYRVPFFLDECGFNDLAKNMSCIIEKPKVYFKRYKWYRLKTRRVCLQANITHYMCAFRARIEQLPKLTLCSVVQF